MSSYTFESYSNPVSCVPDVFEFDLVSAGERFQVRVTSRVVENFAAVEGAPVEGFACRTWDAARVFQSDFAEAAYAKIAGLHTIELLTLEDVTG